MAHSNSISGISQLIRIYLWLLRPILGIFVVTIQVGAKNCSIGKVRGVKKAFLPENSGKEYGSFFGILGY
jgi:hypothetical protein